MKKSEIKNGAILKTRNGMCWFKVDNTLFEVDVKTGVYYNYMPWDDYKDDIKHSTNRDYDVVGVDNHTDIGNGNCNGALYHFLREKTVFTNVNSDPIVAEETKYILKFLLATTPFKYIAKDGDGSYEVYLYRYEPKKVYNKLNLDGTEDESSWYWAPVDRDGAVPDISDLFVSKESKAFFDSLDPNRIYKIEDLIK